jgi:hypothetical protein
MYDAGQQGHRWTFNAYPPALGNQIGALARLFLRERPEAHEMRQLGRGVVWAISVLGICFAAIAGRLAAGRPGAVLAGAFVAFSPLLVEQSRYATTDNPTGSFAALVVVTGLWLYHRPSWLPYVLGGLAVGLAASYKYAGAYSALFLFAAHVLSAARHRLRFWLLLLAAGVLAAAAFVAANFQIVLNPSVWWKEFLFRFAYYDTSHPGFTSDHSWMHAVHYAVAYGLGWGVAAAGGAALVGVVWRGGWREQRATLACLLVGLMYWIFLAKKPVFLARNLVHSLPLVLIGFAALVASLTRGVSRFYGAIGGLLVAALAGVAHNAFLVGRHAQVLAKPDTRLQAAEWLRDHVRPGEKVVGVGRRHYLPPVQLSGVAFSIQREHQLKKLAQGRHRYVVVSWGDIQRYLRDADHEPKKTKSLQRLLATFRSQMRSVVVFQEPQGPGADLFGSSVDLHHNPRIEIFEHPAHLRAQGQNPG